VQTPPAVQAFHVIHISWPNDDLFDASHLSDPGLQIKFDARPDPNALNAGAFIVTLELIKPSQKLAEASPLRDIFVLEGSARVDKKDKTPVTWKANANLGSALAQLPTFESGLEPRVRVHLMGHKLWSAQ